MTVDYAALKDAELEKLRTLIDVWTLLHARAVQSRQSFDDITPKLRYDDWAGDAATAAETRGHELLELIRDGLTEAYTVKSILIDAAQRIQSAQDDLRTTIDTVLMIVELDITGSGTVVLNEAAIDGADALWEVHRATYQAAIDRAVTAADAADRDVANALRLAGETDDSSDRTFNGEALDLDDLDELRADLDADDIPDGDTPPEVLEWWNALSPEERYAYTDRFPGRIGNLDGIPAADRHEANVITLRDEIASGDAPAGSEDLLERIEDTWDGPASDRVYLLGFDPRGDSDTRVIAAIGNPDTADHTGVFVPGTSRELGNLDGSLDEMQELKDAAGGSTSTIVWLGYDTPDTLAQAPSGHFATDGAPALREFTRGLAATHDGDGHTTVIGHSYGATVVGTADALGHQGEDDGLVADDIVAVGSPGMGFESPDRQGWFDGSMVDDTSDLHTDSDHVWVGASSSDHVTYANWFGPDPSRWSFGAERFSTDGARGHDEYFDSDTESLENMARIVTGEYDEVENVGRRPG